MARYNVIAVDGKFTRVYPIVYGIQRQYFPKVATVNAIDMVLLHQRQNFAIKVPITLKINLAIVIDGRWIPARSQKSNEEGNDGQSAFRFEKQDN
ncbi:MAG: hypothetical protein ACR5LG_08315 [Sodalis sp. (in: enterobacteria)]|uniref:hypothetical protein n=1 Tax=Sodalis sp. (in: enterobacteria) TaxID=1898979 RepID=UPI003F3E31AA